LTTCSTSGSPRIPLWIIPIGLVYGAIYYFLFRFVITRWNLRTPGREDEDATVDPNNVLVDQPDDEPVKAARGTAPAAGSTPA